MQRWISMTLITLLAIHSTGCATLIGTTKQTIQVHTQPRMAAHCGLANNKRSWRTGVETPINVERSSSDLQITCVNQTYTGQTNGNVTVQPWTFLNLVTGFFAIIGFGVDAMTGAMFSYDNHITVMMQPRQNMMPSTAQPRFTPQPQGQFQPRNYPQQSYRAAPATAPAASTPSSLQHLLHAQ